MGYNVSRNRAGGDRVDAYTFQQVNLQIRSEQESINPLLESVYGFVSISGHDEREASYIL